MKKIITVLALAVFSCNGLIAQTKTLLCHRSHSHTTRCYKTRYAQNFKVCKDELGYHICGEQRRTANSTWPIGKTPFAPTETIYAEVAPVYSMNSSITAMPPVIAPINQSYPVTGGELIQARSYQGYYRKGKIKVCYVGDNVAELNRASQHACPADHWDGPEKNNTRNLNVNQPVHLAPSGGNGGWGF